MPSSIKFISTGIVIIIACSLIPVSGWAQEKHEIPDLELRFRAKDPVQGLPQTFTFLLANTGGQDLRIPIPAVGCWSLENGGIRVLIKFIPKQSPYPPGIGGGCGSGVYDRSSILQRVKDWKLLHPGEDLVLEAKRERFLYDYRLPGTYEFWATYSPPKITPSEQKMLEERGISFPRIDTESNHLTFRKR